MWGECVKLSISTSKQCKGGCTLDENGDYCICCNRTIEEIKAAYEELKQERLTKEYWNKLPA